jgi:hypothetical protein
MSAQPASATARAVARLAARIAVPAGIPMGLVGMAVSSSFEQREVSCLGRWTSKKKSVSMSRPRSGATTKRTAQMLAMIGLLEIEF